MNILSDASSQRGRSEQLTKLSAGNLLRTTALASALMSICFGGSALAQSSDDRIDELEAKLDMALELVQQLSSEVETLKRSRGGAGTAGGSGAGGSGAKLAEIEETVRENQKRLVDVEDSVINIDAKTGSRALVKAFEASSLDIGGFLHSVFSHVDGDAGSATGFNRQAFELLIKANMTKKWSAFIAQAFIRESDVVYTDPFGRQSPTFSIQTKSPTVIAWANYKASDAFNVRIGRWITPHGIINVEHFPAILLDPEQPQFLRPFGGQTIFANFMTGVQVHGQKFVGMGGEGKLSYALYLGNFAGNTQDADYGGRLAYAFGRTGVTVGLNAGAGTRNGSTNSGYSVYGADLLIDKGPILWKSEVFATDEDSGGDRFAVYTQPAWRINSEWTGFYRFDFLDDGTGNGDKTEHAFGLTFRPDPIVHLRGIVTLKDFDASDDGLLPAADQTIYHLSATFSF